jgi:formylglycine-generating enzyme required for sulfatase activity
MIGKTDLRRGAALVAAMISCLSVHRLAASVNTAPAAIRDCHVACPEMVLVPAGEFVMGSPADEAGRDALESPAHKVTIAKPFLVGKYDVTVAEYARFVAETKHQSGDTCDERPDVSWRNPGYPLEPTSPVVCVNYVDAHAYLAWLSKKSGHRYRLLSEAEHEYVNRAGTSTPYWWGASVGADHANCNGCGSTWDNRRTSPVGSFPPNPFGLYDTTGDVYVWVEDCWNPTYDNAPSDGAANLQGNCVKRGLKGGGWGSPVAHARAAFRLADPSGARYDNMGFRVARSLDP